MIKLITIQCILIIGLAMSCISNKLYANEANDVPHVWEGNLALPISQQPGALLALGQNIVEKGDTLGLVQFEHMQSNHEKEVSLVPFFLYGITDSSSLFIRAPVAINFKDENQHSSGIGDITAQYEYAYYTKARPTYGAQATVLGGIGFPTGSAKKNPNTGFGATSIFGGATVNYLSVNWYAFLSSGFNIPTSHHGTKYGDQFFYQWGFGKNIAYCPKEWLLTWILEFHGTYQQRDKFCGIPDKNSGNNTILAGYTLWFSTPNLIVIGSVLAPMVQNFFGCQQKIKYELELIVGWKFNG